MDDLFTTTGRNDSGQRVDNFKAPELNKQDYADHHGGIVARALEETDLLQVVELQSSDVQIHILARIKPEFEKRVVHTVIDSILRHGDGKFDSMMGKMFFLKNERTVYGWVFSFSSRDMKRTVEIICDAIDAVIPRKEVTEVPLLGPKPPQGGPMSKRGGAMPIGGGAR